MVIKKELTIRTKDEATVKVQLSVDKSTPGAEAELDRLWQSITGDEPKVEVSR